MRITGNVSVLLLIACLAEACRHETAPVATVAADPESRRTLSTGPVVGFQGTYGSHVWLGIPYAAPPVGALRWRAPESQPVSAGERAALAPGNP
ncbi:MAG: carboxylesterase family protein, partial [Candidatus Binatia bacterium]